MGPRILRLDCNLGTAGSALRLKIKMISKSCQNKLISCRFLIGKQNSKLAIVSNLNFLLFLVVFKHSFVNKHVNMLE